MNKEKLKSIHSKRFLNDDWIEVTDNYENTNGLQFFYNVKSPNPRCWVKCFTERSFRPKWYYNFKDGEQFDNRVQKTINKHNERLKAKEEYKKEKNKPHSLKVGDILYASWGYDQTNIDFFKVTQLLGKRKIKIIGLGSEIEPNGIHDLARPSNTIGNYWSREEITKIASSDNTVKISSFAYATPWHGQGLYQTNPSLGH